MDYCVAGFTFHFGLDGNGDVATITTPDIAIGPVMVLQSSVLHFDPAITVAEAKAAAAAIIRLLVP